MRIYISGKITGTNDYVERFEKAEKRILEASESDVFILNPVRVSAQLPKCMTYDEYIEFGFAMLNMADAIYMMRDWKSSPGACMEYGYARAKGIGIIEEDKED